MPTNLLKKYPDLLEIMHLSESVRRQSLRGIYDRDINCEAGISFDSKRIYPIKCSNGEVDLDRVFTHLTCEDVEVEDEAGKKIKRRIFEPHRSQRLHWIKPHVSRMIGDDNIEFFSILERDQKKRVDVYRTYIYDQAQQYVVVLEPQRKDSYYLLTAYHLNRKYGVKMMKKKMEKRLSELL